MDQNLAYLHEVLSNYTEEHGSARDIDNKIQNNSYTSEEDFVRGLSQGEIHMLEQLLSKEIHHANKSGDHERGYQLTEVYELLY